MKSNRGTLQYTFYSLAIGAILYAMAAYLAAPGNSYQLVGLLVYSGLFSVLGYAIGFVPQFLLALIIALPLMAIASGKSETEAAMSSGVLLTMLVWFPIGICLDIALANFLPHFLATAPVLGLGWSIFVGLVGGVFGLMINLYTWSLPNRK